MPTSFLRRGALAAGLGAILAMPAAADTLGWLTYKPQAAADPQAVTTQWFADEFARRTGGKHTITVHWGGSVAKIREIPDALSAGVGQIGDIVTPYYPDKFVVNNAVSFFIPQPASTIELGEMMERWNDDHPQFDEEMARYNLKIIGYRPLESYGMICTRPIRSAADFEGLRIRSFGFALPALIEALGGTPVSMSTPEAYEALQRGILDCSPVGPTLVHGWKYDEVAKYFIDVPMGALWGHLIAMNREAYDGLDEQTRAIIDGLGTEYLVEYSAAVTRMTEDVKAKWKEMGVEIIPFPRDELVRAAQSDLVQKVRAEWIAKAAQTGLPAEEIAAELQLQ